MGVEDRTHAGFGIADTGEAGEVDRAPNAERNDRRRNEGGAPQRPPAQAATPRWACVD